MSDNKHPVRDFMFTEAKKWVSNLFFAGFGLMLMVLLTPFGDQAKAVWNEPQNRQAQFESIIKSQEQFEATQKQILQVLRELTGEDRIIRQPPNMSFVREPVNNSDNTIQLVLFVGRTALGAECVLKETVPKYLDTNDVTITMEPRRARSQIRTEVTRNIITIEKPSMPSGRTGISLQLEYLCDNRTVFDNTDEVYFYNN